jgi:hypothetical protein
MHCTRHRVFLAALICAAKYLNDASPKNKHWARYASLFSLAEVNLMEKQLLYLLDYDLRTTEEELLVHVQPFIFSLRAKKAAYESSRSSARSSVVQRGVYVQERRAEVLLPTPSAESSPPLLERSSSSASSSGSSASERSTSPTSSPMSSLASALSSTRLQAPSIASSTSSTSSTVRTLSHAASAYSLAPPLMSRRGSSSSNSSTSSVDSIPPMPSSRSTSLQGQQVRFGAVRSRIPSVHKPESLAAPPTLKTRGSFQNLISSAGSFLLPLSPVLPASCLRR